MDEISCCTEYLSSNILNQNNATKKVYSVPNFFMHDDHKILSKTQMEINAGALPSGGGLGGGGSQKKNVFFY